MDNIKKMLFLEIVNADSLEKLKIIEEIIKEYSFDLDYALLLKKRILLNSKIIRDNFELKDGYYYSIWLEEDNPYIIQIESENDNEKTMIKNIPVVAKYSNNQLKDIIRNDICFTMDPFDKYSNNLMSNPTMFIHHAVKMDREESQIVSNTYYNLDQYDKSIFFEKIHKMIQENNKTMLLKK